MQQCNYNINLQNLKCQHLFADFFSRIVDNENFYNILLSRTRKLLHNYMDLECPLTKMNIGLGRNQNVFLMTGTRFSEKNFIHIFENN